MASNTQTPTPTKVKFSVKLTPTSKHFQCLLCGEVKQQRSERRLLMKDNRKTELFHLTERLLNINITEEDHSEVCCRNCSRRLQTIDKSLEKVKQSYHQSRQQLTESHGQKIHKRMARDDGTNTRKRALFSHETSEIQADAGDNDSDLLFQPLSDEEEMQDLSAVPYQNLMAALKSQNEQKIVDEIMKNAALSDGIQDKIFDNLMSEVKRLCSKEESSILRNTDKNSLMSFSFKNVETEWKEKAPTFYRFLTSSSSNPRSQIRNKTKKGEALLFAQVSAGSKLLNLYNREMKAMHYLNDVILLKGGLKKSAFNRMQSTGDCHGYTAAIAMADSFADNWDEQLIEAQTKATTDMEIENQLIQQISYLTDTIELCQEGGHDTTDLILERSCIERELEKHRACMHPGYYFVGDNVDMMTKVRHMTLTRQNRDQHMYQICAYIYRIDGNNLDNTRPQHDPSSVPFSMVVPGVGEHEIVLDNFAFLVAKQWCEHIAHFTPYQAVLPPYISHPHLKDTKKRSTRINMGVLKKNETKNEDMVDICKFLHQYVPGHDEMKNVSPAKVLSGGDYLTFERHKQAQMSLRDDETPSLRLEGLIPKMEEFHNQAELLKVLWKYLYSTSPSRDIGTLFAARNITNARNVTADPSGNYYASELMADKFTYAYIIAGALEHFDMEDMTSEPKTHRYQGEVGNTNEMRDYIMKQARDFVHKFVKLHVKPLPAYGPQSNTLKCRFCGKAYKKAHGLRKHEHKEHSLEDPLFDSESSVPSHAAEEHYVTEDMIFNYTMLALSLGLLRLNHNDAISMGDGDRMMLVNQFLYLLYKQANCPKYAFGLLETTCQTKILLTARLAHRLKWNRTVNHRGKHESNHPNDLDLEHCNKVFKNEVHSFRGVFTEKTIARVSRSALCTERIAKNIDAQTCTRSPSGLHKDADLSQDINTIVTQLKQHNIFKCIPGRNHESFPTVKPNPYDDLDMEAVRDWISNSLQKFSKKHYY